MEKKKHKTDLDFKYGSRSMNFYKDYSKYMSSITTFGIFIFARPGLGGKNGPSMIQRTGDHF
jgi:hypothetical protein